MQNSTEYSNSSTTSKAAPSLLAQILVFAVRLYQLTLSHFFAGSCRFHPSCSTYALDALREYGALKGSYLAVGRILRCHPWNAGGYDPIPERKHN